MAKAKRRTRRAYVRNAHDWGQTSDICNAPGKGGRRCWLDEGHRGKHQDDSTKPWVKPTKRKKRASKPRKHRR